MLLCQKRACNYLMLQGPGLDTETSGTCSPRPTPATAIGTVQGAGNLRMRVRRDTYIGIGRASEEEVLSLDGKSVALAQPNDFHAWRPLLKKVRVYDRNMWQGCVKSR